MPNSFTPLDNQLDIHLLQYMALFYEFVKQVCWFLWSISYTQLQFHTEKYRTNTETIIDPGKNRFWALADPQGGSEGSHEIPSLPPAFKYPMKMK